MKKPEFTPDQIDSLSPDEVFVFGSNLGGHHGGGAARAAINNYEEIAPLFREALELLNVCLPESFVKVLKA